MIWASSRENLPSVFSTRSCSNQPAQLQRLARNLKVRFVASLDAILSNKRITKALIRLRGCAVWSAPLLFAKHRRQGFSRRGQFIRQISSIFYL